MAFLSYNVTEPSGAGSLIFAESGTVVITQVTPHGIDGSFDAVTQENHLAGTFSASACEPWERSDDVPGPSNC